MERYELVDGKAAKFWQWEVRGAQLVVEYGRIGTKGQSSVKTCANEAAAREAAAKLVKEKTGKGYARVGGAASGTTAGARRAATTSAAAEKSPAATRASSPPPRGSAGNAALSPELAALAAKLSKKASTISHPGQWLIDELGHRQGLRALWPMAATAPLSPKALVALLGALDENVGLATSEQLIAVLLRVPTTLDKTGAPFMLDDYPKSVDGILMHATHRAPGQLAAVEGRLPPNLRRALPWVRRRLGQDAPAPTELLTEIARHHLKGGGHDTAWDLVDGALVRRLERSCGFDAAAMRAAAAGPREAFVAQITADAFVGGDRNHTASWRAEPYYLAQPAKLLPKLLAQTWDDPFQFRMLAARNDPPETLLAAIKGLKKDTLEVVGDRVAVLAALRLAAAKAEIPKTLDGLLDFNHGPSRHAPEFSVYLAGLRAFPRARLLARFDALVAKKNAEPIDAVRALAAHWDADRFVKLAKDPELQRHGAGLGEAGPAAIPVLIEQIRALPPREPNNWTLRNRHDELRAAVSIAVVGTDEPIDPAWDAFIGPTTSGWQHTLARLPARRRDAVLLRAQELDVTKLAYFTLASDTALDTAIARLATRRQEVDKDDTSLAHAFAELGARATAPLVTHFAGKTDAFARNVLGVSQLDDATYAQIVGGAGSALPVVQGNIAQGATYLASVFPHLLAAAPVGQLILQGAHLACIKGAYGDVHVLDRDVPVGAHPVTAAYANDLDAEPSAGLEALMVRFASGTPVRWVEVRNRDDQPVMGEDDDFVGMTLVDADYAKAHRKALTDAFEPSLERHLNHGNAVGLFAKDRAVFAYVGEIARSHKLFWGLAAGGVPLCLIAAFELPSGGGDGDDD